MYLWDTLQVSDCCDDFYWGFDALKKKYFYRRRIRRRGASWVNMWIIILVLSESLFGPFGPFSLLNNLVYILQQIFQQQMEKPQTSICMGVLKEKVSRTRSTTVLRVSVPTHSCLKSDVYWGHAWAGKRGLERIPGRMHPATHQTKLGGCIFGHMGW
jgi:hypothetical protein